MCGFLSIRKILEQPHFQHQYPRSPVESVKATVGSVSHGEMVTVNRTEYLNSEFNRATSTSQYGPETFMQLKGWAVK